MVDAIDTKKPTEETSEIDDHWSEDQLGRYADAVLLKSFLLAQYERNLKAKRPKTETREALVVNLDAPWGTGKTFFLDRFEHELEPSCVIRINAWENDFGEDPLIAISQPILKKISSPKSKRDQKIHITVDAARVALGKIIGAGIRGVIRQAAKKALGDEGTDEFQKTVADIASDMTTEAGDLSADGVAALLNEHAEKKHALVEFRDAIAALIESKDQPHNPPIFVLVDELDRCRPTYAISFLEKIKHIFQIPQFVFLIATDTTQLEKAVKAVYGAEFDSRTYLRRFFKFTYHLPEDAPFKLVQAAIGEYEWTNLVPNDFPLTDFIAVMGLHFRCSTRDLLQSLELAYAASTQIAGEQIHLPMLICEAITYLKIDKPMRDIDGDTHTQFGLSPSSQPFRLGGDHYALIHINHRTLSPNDILARMKVFSSAGTEALMKTEEQNRIVMFLVNFERRARASKSKILPREYAELVRRCGQVLSDISQLDRNS